MSGTPARSRRCDGLDARAQSHHPAAGCHLSRSGKLTHATLRRNVLIRSAQAGTAAAPISRCSPPTRRRSSCACSTARAAARLERIELPERTEDVWHGYLQRRLARPALRLSRSRPLRARARPPLQSQQAADRSLRQAARPAGWSGAMRISPIAPAARARTCRSTGATMRAACPRPSWSTRPSTWGRANAVRNVPWEDTIIYEAHVKGLTQTARGRAAGPARHLSRPRRRRR